MAATSGWGTSLTGHASTVATLEAVSESYESMQAHVVGSEIDYSVFVEFGTYKMPANGALRAAVRDAMAKLPQIVRRADDPDEITELVADHIAERWRRDVWVDTGKLQNSISVEER